MACAYPRDTWQRAPGAQLTFKKPAWASPNNYVSVPCGKCLLCRIDHAQQWAIRCMHELMFHKEACYITLTYRPDNMPPGGSLNYRDVQLFLKRLREKYSDKKIMFLATGEYGTKLKRPHYHLILFGIDFDDKKPLRKTRAGRMLYHSETLHNLWGNGFVSVGETVTYQTCAYVAKYTVKSSIGMDSPTEKVDLETGEVFTLAPEFLRSSKRPGIGKRFYEKYRTQLEALDRVIHDGKEYKLPRYYDRLMSVHNPSRLEVLKADRKRKASEKTWDGSFYRLATKHTVSLLNYRIKGRGKFQE